MSLPSTVLHATSRPRVLCVDDEPQILESLRDTLRRSFDVRVAGSGPEGLVLLAEEPTAYAVIVSDMRMPLMPGSIFLREARRIAPDAVRILLTGYADLDAAVDAVNEAQLFRFLTKPSPATEVLAACQAALEQHRLQTAERVLLEQTLRGAVRAITDILALASPAAFGRSARVRKLVAAMAAELSLPDAWAIEVAALLANLGAVTLPAETAEKLYAGAPLTHGEQEMVDRVPELSRRILEHIPRLEDVTEILDGCQARRTSWSGRPPIGSRILRIVLDFEDLQAHGADHDVALGALRGRDPAYDPALLDALSQVVGHSTEHLRVREIRSGQLRAGMMLAGDVRSDTGSLLIARGHTATDQLVARLLNLRAGSIREPVLIIDQD